MARANIATASGAIAWRTSQEDFSAFDGLPAPIRAWVSIARLKHDVVAIAETWALLRNSVPPEHFVLFLTKREAEFLAIEGPETWGFER